MTSLTEDIQNTYSHVYFEKFLGGVYLLLTSQSKTVWMWNNEDDQERLSHTAADSKRGLPARGDSHHQICGIRIEGLKSKVLTTSMQKFNCDHLQWGKQLHWGRQLQNSQIIQYILYSQYTFKSHSYGSDWCCFNGTLNECWKIDHTQINPKITPIDRPSTAHRLLKLIPHCFSSISLHNL